MTNTTMVSSTIDEDASFKGKLIAAVKKDVKQLMEESVTRKFVHEDSGTVTSLCGTVEACLSQGLKRRALGLFKTTSSTTALLHKIAKYNTDAATIARQLSDYERDNDSCGAVIRRTSSSSDSLTQHQQRKHHQLSSSSSAVILRHLWIRLALFDRSLARIIDYLVCNALKYYEKNSLVADAEYGTILGSLLVGPCALDYSRSKSLDQYWTDPPADELVQRHRVASGRTTPPKSCYCPNFKRHLLHHNSTNCCTTGGAISTLTSGSSEDLLATSTGDLLHQNARSTLLFGKNNVQVVPTDGTAILGYLSLHQMAQHLTIKWTPNQLINGGGGEANKDVYWGHVLDLNLDDIIYVHCHRQEMRNTVILVGQDGVQHPPIQFPTGGHMLAFLSCIETGLLPHGRLDPPLWLCQSPLVKKRRQRACAKGGERWADTIFRIVDGTNHQREISRPAPKTSTSSSSSSGGSSMTDKSFEHTSTTSTSSIDAQDTLRIKAVCDSMKRQIISRAFYGWLAYCRHLSTVRTHLSALIQCKIVEKPPDGGSDGVTVAKWQKLCPDGVLSNQNRDQLYHLTYFGGIEAELRHQVWPYLLGHYRFESTDHQRHELDRETRQLYETVMSEWLAIEVIVRQRDRDKTRFDSDSVDNDVEHVTLADDKCPDDVNLSPVSSNGGVYSMELLENFALNLHRIEKDVQRCDRNYHYFHDGVNLDKLQNVMCTYVWEHLDVGYMQGMCDLVAPLLVVFNDESLTYACFCQLMERMLDNFPHGNAMDRHFANMRSLIQILDGEMYELMHQNGDYTHFYFCYRWFLLDFKRELLYQDIFRVWEVIWAAQYVASTHFGLFLALALLETYRDIIVANGMDFTDIIRFFNEMAERHDVNAILNLARDLVHQLQLLIENK